ncbi:bifunctional phosphopantothenoylcysteine decarboxylase/phosphopantothenate--cysteine ligase CoaBC [Lactiplantibacillus mudanjiangensis]|uniref:Coenzyme A biosynthesis bifunctional protein CoaBC n=1 Tax=Lactiplantibacillus mudanjiangensis TaxID=1296538 RepID=A0A660E2E2_9LACO|nr:bifunctional phosphopantothenoylcysteine decarboxylase/phosphopantothenate--cysteine ligase CoaBC [Lactiplantibacillus mudanjiangensis]VDG24514.1 bifunctional phosphopantothenoylcysteine decarboxylase/phosphopantothenate--cysteine ligase CoaBC [Lactobacillus sp.] [Lactiplantibacillus mudanjiangensis]VDG29805.1 bifunctional phosphopantothenoylcysteine decarboxylase/phosphopantothenate--cysteine ligase CoaBC [Lactobacillus sp.] [Lactiplantibacillus mudanjiangensis]
MSIWQDRHVTVVVSGGIASYKAIYLIRQLMKQGATVRVAMTPHAAEFVTPLTFQTLTQQPVVCDEFTLQDPQHVVHVELADWTDSLIVVPATANIIAKMAVGLADDAATTTILATTAPKYVVPAMNSHMYANPATQRNLAQLTADGMHVLTPATGMLAEGYAGQGRLPEPDVIYDWLTQQHLLQATDLPLHGKRVLVTAGGTREMLDPVRYISNRSSGKMGYAVARVARELGAKVTLISTPTALTKPAGVTYTEVTSAADLAKAVKADFEETDLLVMAAAVSDFKPTHAVDQKIKKQPGQTGLTLELAETEDILKTLAPLKTHQFVVGFAAETQHLIENAEKKLAAKKLDMLVANDVSKPGVGFNGDTNQVTLLTPNSTPMTTNLLSKTEIAQTILKAAIERGV